MLNRETVDVNGGVVLALVVVAHLEKGPVSLKVLLEGLEGSTVEGELKVAILKAHLVVESGFGRDSANLV